MAGDRPVLRRAGGRVSCPADRIPDNVMVTGGHRRRRHSSRSSWPTGASGRAPQLHARRRAGADDAGSRRSSRPSHPASVPGAHPRLRRLLRGRLLEGHLAAAGEGYDSVELLKRYTTATMGPAQGKLETVNTVAVLAEATGRSDRRDRHDRVAAAARARQPRRARRPRPRAGPLLADAAMARSATAPADRRRPMDSSRALRRPGGEVANSAATSASSTSRRSASLTCGARTSPSCSTSSTSTSGRSSSRRGPLRGDVRRGRRGPR